MSKAIESAIHTTQQAFLQGVWPNVADAIGGGKIVPVEAVSDKKFLDMYSGIDHWHVLENRSLIRGIASRCQWPKYKHFQTFTIRIGRAAVKQTELAKRLYAMEHADQGWVRPHLFIQAFFSPPWGSYERFLYAGIAKMDDILTVIRDGKEGNDWYRKSTDEKWGQHDNKEFAVVPFDVVRKRGLSFRLVSSAVSSPPAA